MITFVNNRYEAERRDVLLAVRFLLQRRGGIGWFSRRYLANKALHRGSSRSFEHVQSLIAMGELCRVSARGRGHGKGRTLYWLPGVPRAKVMHELEEEGMPLAAVRAAERFFLTPKKEPSWDRTQSLRGLHPSGPEKKDARAVKLNGPRPRDHPPPLPSGPRRPQPKPNQVSGAPPSLRRLARPGLESVASILGRITEDPATHPFGCGCAPCHSGTVDGA